MRGAVRARAGVYAPAVAALPGAVRDGGVAFDRAHGVSFFEWASSRPAQLEAFQRSMADRAAREAADVVDAYDFDRFTRLVDVGGGTGVLLSAVLAATPGLHAVLLDRPEVVAQARVAADLVPGDFFTAVPAGGDAYLLARVLHDWDDGDAHRILVRCREAATAGTTLLLVEAVLPERAADAPAVVRMDATMLLLATGRERTEREFTELLDKAGWALGRVVPTASPVGVVVLEATAV